MTPGYDFDLLFDFFSSFDFNSLSTFLPFFSAASLPVFLHSLLLQQYHRLTMPKDFSPRGGRGGGGRGGRGSPYGGRGKFHAI